MWYCEHRNVEILFVVFWSIFEFAFETLVLCRIALWDYFRGTDLNPVSHATS